MKLRIPQEPRMPTELERLETPVRPNWSLRDLFGVVLVVAVALAALRENTTAGAAMVAVGGMLAFARLVLIRPSSAARTAVLWGGLCGGTFGLLLGPITMSFHSALPLVECLAFFFTAGFLAAPARDFHATLRTATFWSVAGGCSVAVILPMFNKMTLRSGDAVAGLVASALCGLAGAFLAWLITSVMQRETDDGEDVADTSLRSYGTRLGAAWLWPLVLADLSFFWLTDHRRVAVCVAVALSTLAGNLVGASIPAASLRSTWRAGLRGALAGALLGTVLAVAIPFFMNQHAAISVQPGEVARRMVHPQTGLVPLGALVGWSLVQARQKEVEPQRDNG